MTECDRIVVIKPPGRPITLELYADAISDPVATIVLGPADALNTATELLIAARRRFGRMGPFLR